MCEDCSDLQIYVCAEIAGYKNTIVEKRYINNEKIGKTCRLSLVRKVVYHEEMCTKAQLVVTRIE